MRITLQRVGGFAGLAEELASIDTARLEGTEAEDIDATIKQVRFYDLPEKLPTHEAEGADEFHYQITIDGDEGCHTVAYIEEDNHAPSAIQPLVDAISQVAGPS